MIWIIYTHEPEAHNFVTNELESYDPREVSKHIVYIDANNLYGSGICKFYPKSRFEWIHPKEFELNKCNSNSSEKCVLEFGLEYPKEL